MEDRLRKERLHEALDVERSGALLRRQVYGGWGFEPHPFSFIWILIRLEI